MIKFSNFPFSLYSKAQVFPVVELKEKSHNRKHPSVDDSDNDNNVWIPKTENQISKNGKQQRESEKVEKMSMKKKKNDVFPSDIVIRKARDAGKLKSNVNEKSRGGVKASSIIVNERKQEMSDGKLTSEIEQNFATHSEMMCMLGKITDYQRKICQHLDHMRDIIEDPPEIEDTNDLNKRQKRATEFTSRFARNHLYQIGRNVSKILYNMQSFPPPPPHIKSEIYCIILSHCFNLFHRLKKFV